MNALLFTLFLLLMLPASLWAVPRTRRMTGSWIAALKSVPSGLRGDDCVSRSFAGADSRTSAQVAGHGLFSADEFDCFADGNHRRSCIDRFSPPLHLQKISCGRKTFSAAGGDRFSGRNGSDRRGVDFHGDHGDQSSELTRNFRR